MFTYNDLVSVVRGSPLELRPGEPASVVAVIVDRRGSHFDQFPPGVVYSIEFEDGVCIDVHESILEPVKEGGT